MKKIFKISATLYLLFSLFAIPISFASSYHKTSEIIYIALFFITIILALAGCVLIYEKNKQE